MRILMHDVLAEGTTSRADRAALTFREVTLTYGELWREVAAFARGLRRIGLSRGERVVVYLDKRIENVTAIFGVSAAGGVFVPANPLLKPQQLVHVLNDSGARVLVTSGERLEIICEALGGCKALENVIAIGGGAEHQLDTGVEVVAWEDACVAGDADTGSGIGTDGIDIDPAAIFYTSGSTGRPKGVVLSHRNILVGAESVSSYLGNTPDDVILAALPLSFDAGFSQLTTGFSAGAHVVLLNYLMPSDVVRLCAKHRVTGLTCVPPLWIQLAEQRWPEEASRHLQYFANTGGRMPRSTLEQLRTIFPAARPYLMYGLTEAFRSTYLDPTEVDRRPDSIGKAIPNAEILVVRPDGTLCDPGEEGELVHRGALVSLGYWNDIERTAERFRPAPRSAGGAPLGDLAVWSGDIVMRDEEGFLYFVGRRDEMIKTSGYRVSPTEIEEAVYDTGMVRDAVAFGVPDPRLGQHIVVAVSPAEAAPIDSDALIDRLRKVMPSYMVPQKVVVRSELPRSPNGKFDRQMLRRELGET